MIRPRISLAAAAIAAMLAVCGFCDGGALAQELPPTLQAVAGEPFTATAQAVDPLDATCTALRAVSINWRDGTSSPPSSAALVPGSEMLGDTTIPDVRVSVSVAHTFAVASDYDVRVSYTVTCTSPDGSSSDFEGVDKALFIVHVSAGSGSGSGCAGTARDRSSAAHTAQAACPYPPPAAAPKTAVPKAVKDYFHAKDKRLAERSAFWCGDWNVPSPANFLAFNAFAPICYPTIARLLYYQSIVQDPPDAGHAGVLALPARLAAPALGRPRCTTGACRAAVRALTRFAGAADRVASIARAQSATVDRFSGAVALAGIRSAAEVNDMQVLQAAAFKALGGELATALSAQHAAGLRLAAALKRAHINASLSDAKARAQAKRLERLGGLNPALLAALRRNGITAGHLRALFTAAAPHARGGTLSSALTSEQDTSPLAARDRSLSAAELAYIENALASAHKITASTHALLRRALQSAAAAATPSARQAAMRQFAAAARGLAGEAGTLLRTAGQAVR